MPNLNDLKPEDIYLLHEKSRLGCRTVTFMWKIILRGEDRLAWQAKTELGLKALWDINTPEKLQKG